MTKRAYRGMDLREPRRVDPIVQVPWRAPVPVTGLELSLPAVPESVRDARTAVGDLVAQLTGKETVVDDVRLCVSEAVTNVVRHAYPSVPRTEGRVDVGVDCGNGELRVVVRDTGCGIAIESSREMPGGYGLEIIDRLTTRHTVVSGSDSGTEVAMVFALDTSKANGSHSPR